MKKIITIAIATLVLAVLAGLFGLYGMGQPFIVGLNVGETFVMTVLHAGICVLFFMGLGAFKQQFKRAYAFLCAGVIFLAIAVLQYTILGSANALDSFWVRSGAIELAFVFSIFSMLMSLGKFARLMGVAHLARYIWSTLAIAVVLSAVATQLPSPRTDIDPYTLFVTSALYTFQAVMLIAFVPLAYQIRKKAGPLYVPMFAWLFTSYLVYAIQLAVTVYALFFFSAEHWYTVYGATMGFFFVAAVCLLRAAVALNRIRFSEPPAVDTKLSFYGKPLQQSTEQQTKGAVDAIVYLAGLLSNLEAADPVLDGMREVTSQGTDGQGFTPDQQKQLAAVYIRIENFLIDEETIGKYDRTDLRQRVQKFHNTQETIFWQALEAKS